MLSAPAISEITVNAPDLSLYINPSQDEVVEDVHNAMFNEKPTFLKERYVEAIRTWCCV